MQDALPLVGAAHAMLSIVEQQCRHLCSPYGD
jgi:hypothetical protein